MESDPLQQLRDVHLPADPSWWPPAIGWWLLGILLLALTSWLVIRALTAYRRRAAMRASRTVLTDLYSRYSDEQISASEYLHKSNELLKRVLVRAYGQTRYARLSGQAWLTALDSLSNSSEFTNGAGRALGEGRFSANPEIDVEALHAILQKLLQQAKPWQMQSLSQPVLNAGPGIGPGADND